MNSIARRSVVAFALALAACAPAAPAGLSEAVKTQLKASGDEFSKKVLAKDYAGLAAMYTADATFMPPNEPAAKGRAEIQKWMTNAPQASAFSITVDDVDGSGDVAYVRGTYTMTVTVPGVPAPVTDHGKFLEVHKKQADGSWPMIADQFNSDLPAAPTPPAPAAAKPKT